MSRKFFITYHQREQAEGRTHGRKMAGSFIEKMYKVEFNFPGFNDVYTVNACSALEAEKNAIKRVLGETDFTLKQIKTIKIIELEA